VEQQSSSGVHCVWPADLSDSSKGLRTRAKNGRPLRTARPLAALLAKTALSSPAEAVNVSTEAELRNAIFSANGGGDSSIDIIANVTLTKSLAMIAASVTVTGNGNMIDANSTGRVFFVHSGMVSITNVTISNAVAQGDVGSNAAGQAQGSTMLLHGRGTMGFDIARGTQTLGAATR
jgi:hypothetical protein